MALATWLHPFIKHESVVLTAHQSQAMQSNEFAAALVLHGLYYLHGLARLSRHGSAFSNACIEFTRSIRCCSVWGNARRDNGCHCGKAKSVISLRIQPALVNFEIARLHHDRRLPTDTLCLAQPVVCFRALDHFCAVCTKKSTRLTRSNLVMQCMLQCMARSYVRHSF